MATNEIAVIEHDSGFSLPTLAETQSQLAAITAFQQACQRHMVRGSDFGVIPGTQKPTLLKPGAEKIIRLLGLSDDYEIEAVKDWEKPFFAFQVKCRLRHLASGLVIATGVGECNSMEAKYRWRKAARVCPQCSEEAIIKGKVEYGGGWLCFGKKGGCGAKWPDGAEEIESQPQGRVENDDIYSQVNTILKMGKKRALVDAALSAGRLSEVFTQDIEDMAPTDVPFDDAQAPQQPLSAPNSSRAPQRIQNAPERESAPNNWQRFTTWLTEQIRTLTDVSDVIGVEATEQSVVNFITSNGIGGWGAFQEYLMQQWSGQGDEPPEQDEMPIDEQAQGNFTDH